MSNMSLSPLLSDDDHNVWPELCRPPLLDQYSSFAKRLSDINLAADTRYKVYHHPVLPSDIHGIFFLPSDAGALQATP